MEIANHPTKQISDPEFIINFINEIGRNKETKEALDGKREFPSGNWIHTFNTFRDIADVLKPEVFNGIPIDEAIMQKLLLSELRDLLQKNLIKIKGQIFSPQNTIANFYSQHELEPNFSLTGYTYVIKKTWDLFKLFIVLYTGKKYNIQILPKALSSSSFLEFNNEHGIFEETPVHQSLSTLHKEINLFSAQIIPNVAEFLQKYPDHSTLTSNDKVKVANMDLIAVLHTLQRWSNIITISKSVINYLENGTFVNPEIFDQSPIPSMNMQIEKDTVTNEELNLFIKK